MRVCIDARLVSGTSGGIESVVIGLASGLSELHDGSEEYVFLTHRGADDWLRPHIYGPCRIEAAPSAPRRSSAARAAGQRVLSATPALRALWQRLPGLPLERTLLPPEGAPYKQLHADVIHFPFQNAFLTDTPSIYNPHDLQHLYYPQLFSRRERRSRAIRYAAFCSQARVVAVTAKAVKHDLIDLLGIPGEKVKIIPWAPVLERYPVPSPTDIVNVRDTFSLPERFVLYPAQTWSHKNHMGLLDAVALLRGEVNVTVPVVCTGRRTDFFPVIERHAEKLGVSDQLRWLDFVSPGELYALYKACQCVIVPTRFEAASGPLWEAFYAGAPAACSAVTSLPDQAGDAALLFDPDDTDAIAQSIYQLWTDEHLVNTLVTRGKARVGEFTWARTAARFRALFRDIAGQGLTEDDRHLLVAAAPL